MTPMTKTKELQQVASALARLKTEDRRYMRFLAEAMLLLQRPKGRGGRRERKKQKGGAV